MQRYIPDSKTLFCLVFRIFFISLFGFRISVLGWPKRLSSVFSRKLRLNTLESRFLRRTTQITSRSISFERFFKAQKARSELSGGLIRRSTVCFISYIPELEIQFSSLLVVYCPVCCEHSVCCLLTHAHRVSYKSGLVYRWQNFDTLFLFRSST